MRWWLVLLAAAAVFVWYPRGQEHHRGGRITLALERPVALEAPPALPWENLRAQLLPRSLPRGMRRVAYSESLTGGVRRLSAVYDLDDLELLGAPWGRMYGPEGRRAGAWDSAPSEGGLLLPHFRYDCRRFNCMFWYTLRTEEQLALKQHSADPYALRSEQTRRLAGTRVQVRLLTGARLVETNGRRESDGTVVWQGSYPALLQAREGTSFSTAGIFVASYHHPSTPGVFVATALVLLLGGALALLIPSRTRPDPPDADTI